MGRKILIVEDEFIIAGVLKNILKAGGYETCGIANTVSEAMDMVNRHQPEFVLLDILLKGELTGIDLAYQLLEKEVPFIYISANSSQEILEQAKITQPYGFVLKPFRDKDVLTALDIAIYRYEHNLENLLRQNAGMQKKIAEIFSSAADWAQKISQFAKMLQPYIPYEFLSVGLRHTDTSDFYEQGFLRTGFDEYQSVGVTELTVITNRKPAELKKMKACDPPVELTTWYNEIELDQFSGECFKKLLIDTYGFKSHLCVPLTLTGERTCYFNFYSRRPYTYNAEHLVLCNRFQPLFNSFMENMIQVANNPMLPAVPEPVALPGPCIAGLNPFDGIIGNSQLLFNVFDKVMQVAGADSSVLILGESGTGKEKIAERIFALSRRKDKPFIKLNCAALPVSLIDSALFGHEKGAFTGANEKKVGKFEQAHTGTIFLDEIGELPLESQSKILRVLQEREIERVGGVSTVKTDVRIIAATNRNLEKEVAEGRFRLDLYYRINVFPIQMPALRDRKEDIPVLAAHFLKIFNRKTGKKVSGISDQVLKSMTQYRWPGNVRELENLIERSVLITGQGIINAMELPQGICADGPAQSEIPVTLVENERAHIIATLKKCAGKIWGLDGAAYLLNIPPTTLNSKMKKLGIDKNSWE